MTFWSRDTTNRPDERLVKETIRTIGAAHMSGELQETPEWAVVAEAAESCDLQVLAVALEVVASHHAEALAHRDVQLIEAVADSIRCGRVAETKALIELMNRSSNPIQQAA